ncbi:beta-glucosidase family protein [Pseudonocardia sp. TRM90224]|uniref:beta-glucosidase family protein n=1 Tax=Pseudonocardia sp. TRM90224 TaxID=2812678 RepID=UPI001E31AA86|nr:glycoside hydrolase family 3 C-terminal domain-containing protein [Pseudonocardia sp. TRM90224]
MATLTVEEKVRLVVGADMWTTIPIERIGLRPVVFSDGPAGVRGTGRVEGETSASFPAPSALAATWDVELAARAGAVFAGEAARHGVDVVLAPQVNLQRTPAAGRHFECYSEDPLLTGAIAVALIRASQDRGVGMSVKHYVANDSETDRTRYRSIVDERTLRECYLAPFERAVHDAGVWSVMGAYSGVDALGAAAPVLEHAPLLTGLLKDEWGFDGVVVSDWLATRSIGAAVRGGLDLQMPGPDGPWGEGLLASVRLGAIPVELLDDKVARLLLLARRVGALGDAPRPEPGTPEQAAVFLREMTARSVVVLRDAAGQLPLAVPADRPFTVALLGPAATDPFIQGGGSAYVRPDHIALPADALREALPATAELVVHRGARARLKPPPLDVADRCTDPLTGERGIRVELLDAAGDLLESCTAAEWNGWLATPIRTDAATARLSTTVHLTEAGDHELGFGTVGRHEVLIDGRVASASDGLVGAEVILSSVYNHPPIGTVTVKVDEPADVDIRADLQVVHPVGYASFARALITHRRPGPSAESELAEAVAAAAAADVAVVMVGTTSEIESEGFDRTGLGLPGNQDELVRRVVGANPRTVVVVNAGAPVLLPWLPDTGTVLWAWLAGQECGTALADVLLGVTEPAGRLPWTLPARAEDVPVPDAVPRDGEITYTEGPHIGYRGWERSGAEPAACFGHGLGWTTWEHEQAEVTTSPDGATVHVTVRNTGARAGREVVQVYVEPPAPDPERPVRWLGGFAVVEVEPGATATVAVNVPRRAFEVWDTAARDWALPPGEHVLRIGRSIRDLRLRRACPRSPLTRPDPV